MILEGFFALLSNLILFTSRLEGNNSFPKPLSPEKEAEYLKKFKEEGDLEARDILIKHNLRLVVFIAKKYVNYPDNDDLVSIGTLGLIKAVNSFDPKKGTQLATYASRCIENEMLMTMRSYKKRMGDVSLFGSVGSDKDGNELLLIDLLSVDEEIMYTKVETKILKEKLTKKMTEVLSLRERCVLAFRFGLEGGEPKTQQTIADEMGISRSYVSRIEKKALNKLKNALGTNQF